MKPRIQLQDRSGPYRPFAVRLRAVLVSLIRRVPLPPGRFTPHLDKIEAADRLGLLRIADEAGPIFKGQAWGELWIYVLGLPQCRQILRAHETDLSPVTINVTGLFDIGLLRQMEGETHRRYRAALVQALVSLQSKQDLADNRTSTAAWGDLDRIGDTPLSDQAFRTILARIVFDELAQVVFGIKPGGPAHRQLADAYNELGGNGLVWNIGKRQVRAYETIAAIIHDHITEVESGTLIASSVLSGLLKAGPVDAVLLGNLIYMVEMGRYDTAAFFRWLSWFAAMHPDWMDRIAEEKAAPQTTAAAFVMEVLRLEQSERLVRRVKRDFVAAGYLFPKGAKVRFCVWESHKSPEAHEDPFRFDPGRFLGDRPGPDRYAPFGLDKHQCPFGTYSVQLGASFLTALAQRFHLGMAGAGPAVRGLYHWEPAENFCPVLTRRELTHSAADPG